MSIFKDSVVFLTPNKVVNVQLFDRPTDTYKKIKCLFHRNLWKVILKAKNLNKDNLTNLN